MSQAAQLDPMIFPPGTVVQHLTGNLGGLVDPDFGNNIDILGFLNITVTGNPLANNLVINLSGTTENAVQIGNAAGSLTSVTVGTLGQILTQGATVPVWLDGSAINLGAIQYAVIVGTASGSVTSLPVGQTGQTLMGNTLAYPSWTASPSFGGSVTALNDITTTTGDLVANYGNVYAFNNGNAHDASDLNFGKSRIGGALASGDEIGSIKFNGYDGTTYIPAAKIETVSSGTIGTNRVAGNISFYTHPDNVIALPSDPIERMSINSNGNVVIKAPDGGVALTIDNGGEVITVGDLSLIAGNVNLPPTTSSVGQIYVGTAPFMHAYGLGNVFLGGYAGNFTLDPFLSSFNTGIGEYALNDLASGGNSNTAIGVYSLTSCTSGTFNSAFGRSLGNLKTGSYNIGIGGYSGLNYTTNESSNICIGHNVNGTAGESNVLRIGDGTGTGSGQLNAAYISGVYNKTVGATSTVVLSDSADLMGGLPAGTTGYVLTQGATAPSWQPSPPGGINWSQVAGNTIAAAVNYGYINQNAGLTTITLPATAAYGSVIEIIGEGAGGWTIVHPVAGHYIQYGNLATTANTGSLSSSNRYDTVRLVCRVADTVWQVTSAVGVLNVA